MDGTMALDRKEVPENGGHSGGSLPACSLSYPLTSDPCDVTDIIATYPMSSR